jgi:glycosyltransferase involved in cell wall biosynthesis
MKPRNLRAEYGIPENHKILIYLGVLRKGQGLLTQLDILRFLDRVTMVFVGDGPLEADLKMKTSQMKLDDRAIFVGRIPPAELLNFAASADAGMLLMEDIALNNRLALPQKLFQYLSAGLPQIVSSMPEISRFVRKQKTGIVIASDDPEAGAAEIAGFIFDRERYENARQNCRKSAEICNWENESTKWVEIYNELEAGR